MANTVGVLISGHIFHDCLQGDSPYEFLSLYHFFGQKEGLRPIFFTMKHVDISRFQVHAYEKQADGTFKKINEPIPSIHNRIKPSSHYSIMNQLQYHPHITLFN